MSLEQQVTALVASANALTGAVNTKIGQIDQKVAQVEAAASIAIFSEMNKEVFLNNETGNDSNNGTVNSPVKSIYKALSLVPNGGTVIVRCLSNITNLYGNNPSLVENQQLTVNKSKKLYIDLKNHKWIVKTAQKTAWTSATDPYFTLNQTIICDVYSQFYIYNGDVEIDYASAEHRALTHYNHPNTRAFISVALGFASLLSVNYICAIPSLAIFSLDGWAASRADALLNTTNIRGVGMLKFSGNGGVTNDDIKLSRRAVTIEATFTDN